jgi:hypothetical protein
MSAYNETSFLRMAYDADGSVVLYNSTNAAPYPDSDGKPHRALIISSALAMLQLNDEDLTTSPYHWASNGASVVIIVLFPEARDIDGLYWNISEWSTTHSAYASANTTNGVDGTWVNTNVAPHIVNSPLSFDHRNRIVSTTLSGYKAVRVYTRVGTASTISVRSLHIYGKIAAGETPDRLLFLDTSNSDAEFTKVLDFGDRERGEEVIRTFKLKNNSSTKTITAVQVTAEDLFLEAGDWYTFSEDGVAYQATLNTIGDILPGATQLVYAKRVIADAATIGPQTGRFKASHTAVT